MDMERETPQKTSEELEQFNKNLTISLFYIIKLIYHFENR